MKAARKRERIYSLSVEQTCSREGQEPIRKTDVRRKGASERDRNILKTRIQMRNQCVREK